MKALLLPLLVALLMPIGAPAAADEIDELHENLLYPVVRVSTRFAGGSGTVIYSEDRDDPGSFRTYVLTNHHVIDRAINVVTEWDNLKQREETREANDLVDVQLFSWHKGKIIDTRVVKAAIVAHSEEDDIALLELRSDEEAYPLQIKHVAKLATEEEAGKLRVFQKIYAVGCSLGHDPIHSVGDITDLSDMIDGETYMMGSASVIFGNSGGAVFAKIDGAFRHVGIPSRVAVSYGVVTHMNWFVPRSRIAEFLKFHKLDFFFDAGKTPKQCFQERDALRDGAAKKH